MRHKSSTKYFCFGQFSKKCHFVGVKLRKREHRGFLTVVNNTYVLCMYVDCRAAIRHWRGPACRFHVGGQFKKRQRYEINTAKLVNEGLQNQ